MLTGRWRTLVCFYCGSKSAHKAGSVTQFTCVSCEAENYLDANGQITDPPVQSTPQTLDPVRYAHAPARSASPTPPSPADLNDVFCQKCLKNQYMLKETLASYLPSEDHPQYEQYLETYDDYRQKLEQRYPQICSQCAPRARERIKQSAYLAKTDHLRRMMDRTRHFSPDPSMWGVLSRSFIRLVGIGYVGSTLLQALWHALAAITSQLSASTLIPEPEPLNTLAVQELTQTDYYSHLKEAYTHQAILAARCTQLQSWMPLLLLVATVTIWWNPQLSRNYSRKSGTLTRLREYYSLQVVMLVSKAIAYRFLLSTVIVLQGESLKGAHLFMSLWLFSCLLLSARIVGQDYRSPVSFQLPENAGLPDVVPTSDIIAKSSNHRQHPSSRQPFPVHLLNTDKLPTAVPVPRPLFRAVTPPPADEDDPDAMDWTPSNKASFANLNLSARTSGSSFVLTTQPGPSPFRGTLPPAPMPPAHRLRKPPFATPGAFRKASNTQKKQFSLHLKNSTSTAPVTPARRQRSNDTDDPYDTDATITDFEDTLDSRTTSRRSKTDMTMAAPKFWPQDDFDRKTGLEDIFEDGFTIRDTPNEVARRTRQQDSGLPGACTPTAASRSTSRRNENRWGGFGDQLLEERSGSETIATPEAKGWTSNTLTYSAVAALCLSIATVVVKGRFI